MKMFRVVFAVAAFAVVQAGFSAELVVRVVHAKSGPTVAMLHGLELADTTAPAPFILLKTPEGSDTEAIISDLKNDPLVTWVEENKEVRTADPQNGKGNTIPIVFYDPWMYYMNREEADQINLPYGFFKRPGSRIGIVDTGLSWRVWSIWRRVVASQSFVPGLTSPNDVPRGIDSNHNGIYDEAAGHGSMVAGIVAMTAPNSEMVISKVADSDGLATSWTIIKGVSYCVSQSCKVINLSFGTRTTLTAFDGVAKWVEENDVVLVAPVGNDGVYGAMYPAKLRSVISVAAVDRYNRKADFSNYDRATDMAAPGVRIRSAYWNGYFSEWSGTSFAAPFVAGAIASAIPRFSMVSPHQVRWSLRMTSKNIDDENPDYRGKIGRLLDVAALRGAF